MAESTDALHSAITHWHIEAVSGARDQASVRTSMRSLAANIDSASPATVSASERTRLRGKLEQMIHAAGEGTRPHEAASAMQGPSSNGSISVFA